MITAALIGVATKSLLYCGAVYMAMMTLCAATERPE